MASIDCTAQEAAALQAAGYGIMPFSFHSHTWGRKESGTEVTRLWAVRKGRGKKASSVWYVLREYVSPKLQGREYFMLCGLSFASALDEAGKLPPLVTGRMIESAFGADDIAASLERSMRK